MSQLYCQINSSRFHIILCGARYNFTTNLPNMRHLLLPLLPLLPFFALAQTKPAFEYSEQPDHPYHYVPREGRASNPPFRVDGTSFSIRQVNVDEAGQNILGDAANEPSLVIDPTNPKRMAIGWRQFDSISNNFRQAGHAFSFDAGENWSSPDPIEAGVFRSDPVLDADSEGNFFYNSLTGSSNGFICHVFKSETGSNAWDSGTFAYGGDKQWMAIDRTNAPSNGNVYAFWKTNISSCIGGFTRSLDHGQSYLPCEPLVDDPVRGTLVVSPSGELYACGSFNGGFIVLKSSQPAAIPFQWDMVQTVDLGGDLAYATGPNPAGMLGQVWIEVDQSGGPTHGYIYLLATIRSNEDPADIMLSRSTDGGLTWSVPIRINTDPVSGDPFNGNWQWFGSLSVAPNGRVDVSWFDTRDNPGTFLSRLYYSYSTDGGLSWSPNEALSDAFDPHLGWPQQAKIGDYNHQRSDNIGAQLAWAATFNGEQDVFYSRIVPDLPTATHDFASQNGAAANVSCSPNPFTGSTSFRFLLKKPAHVQVEILDARGRLLEPFSGGELPAGKHALEWESRLGSGLYFYRVTGDGEWMGAGRMVKTGE